MAEQARLTFLADPALKQAFETLCRRQDLTSSQVLRRLIRDHLEQFGALPPKRPTQRPRR